MTNLEKASEKLWQQYYYHPSFVCIGIQEKYNTIIIHTKGDIKNAPNELDGFKVVIKNVGEIRPLKND